MSTTADTNKSVSLTIVVGSELSTVCRQHPLGRALDCAQKASFVAAAWDFHGTVCGPSRCGSSRARLAQFCVGCEKTNGELPSSTDQTVFEKNANLSGVSQKKAKNQLPLPAIKIVSQINIQKRVGLSSKMEPFQR